MKGFFGTSQHIEKDVHSNQKRTGELFPTTGEQVNDPEK